MSYLGLPNVQRLQQTELLELSGQPTNIRIPEAEVLERPYLADACQVAPQYSDAASQIHDVETIAFWE